MPFSEKNAKLSVKYKLIQRRRAKRMTSWPLWRFKALFSVVVVALAFLFWPPKLSTELWRYTSKARNWNDRRERVKEAFANSWEAYEKYAWGEFVR